MDTKVNVVMNLLNSAKLLSKIGLKLTEGTDLTSVQQWQLLGIITRNEGLSLAALCERTVVTKQNITGLIERMRKANLVETWTDPQDKRVTRVKITSKGSKAIDEVMPRAYESNEVTFASLTEQELHTLDELLARIFQQGLLAQTKKEFKE